MTQLPSNLELLYLNKNAFQGTPDLSKLPAALQFLNMDDNEGLCGAMISNDPCDTFQFPWHCKRYNHTDGGCAIHCPVCN